MLKKSLKSTKKWLKLTKLCLSSKRKRNAKLLRACKENNMTDVKLLIRAGADINACDKIGISALMYAVTSGNIEIAKELINHGAKINAGDDTGMTALLYAAKIGNIEMANELINCGAKINASDRNRMTALMYAMASDNIEMANELINHGAEINASDRTGMTALMYAVTSGNIRIVKELINHGANVNASRSNRMTPVLYYAMASDDTEIEIGRLITPLIHAVKTGNVEIVKELINHGADIDDDDIDRRTPLIHAVKLGNVEIVKELIKNKANVEVREKEGKNTPLICAVKSGNVEIVKELIRNKADVDSTDKVGMTPLIHAVKLGNVEIVKELIKNKASAGISDALGKNALIYAVEKGNVAMVKELVRNKVGLPRAEELTQHRVDVDICDGDRRTPLMYAIEKGNVAMVKELIDYGANVYKKDKDRRTPLMLALQSDNQEIVKAATNLSDSDGMTLLTHAVKIGNLQGVKNLIRKGADVEKKDANGKSPLEYAIDEKRMSEMLELMKAGVNISGGYCKGIKRFKGENKIIDIIIAIYEKDAESLDKNLTEYYANLYMKDASQNRYNNAIEALTKINNASRYLKSINSAKNIILKQKRDLEVTIRNANVKEIVEGLEKEVAEINKIIQQIKRFELKLAMDYKQLILKSIIIGKNTMNKQTHVQCINNKSKNKGKEKVQL